MRMDWIRTVFWEFLTTFWIGHITHQTWNWLAFSQFWTQRNIPHSNSKILELCIASFNLFTEKTTEDLSHKQRSDNGKLARGRLLTCSSLHCNPVCRRKTNGSKSLELGKNEVFKTIEPDFLNDFVKISFDNSTVMTEFRFEARPNTKLSLNLKCLKAA
jgi:hypothetical protein